MSDAKDLHKKAILEFDNRAYERAIEYAEKSKEIVEDEIRRYNNAKEQIEASKEIVKSIKKLISIPKAEELIENAESALKIGNYNSAVKLAKEAEEEALRAKKDKEETSEFISSIESEITKIKNSGVKITESEELIEHAKSELNNNNFERARELAEEARRIAIERRDEYNHALSLISEAESIGANMDLLRQSRQAFDNGNYKEAKKGEPLNFPKRRLNTALIAYACCEHLEASADAKYEFTFGCCPFYFSSKPPLPQPEQI